MRTPHLWQMDASIGVAQLPKTTRGRNEDNDFIGKIVANT